MKRTIPPLLIHILIGLAFVAFPIFCSRWISGMDGTNPHSTRKNELTVVRVYAGVFFANYYYLIPKLYFKRKHLSYVAVVAGCFLLIIITVLLLDRQDLFPDSPPSPGRCPHPFTTG